MRKVLLAIALAAASFSFGQSAVPGQITVNHDLTSNVTFAIMLQRNADGLGGGSSWPYSYTGTGSFVNPFEQGADVGKLTMLGIYENSSESGNTTGVNVMVNNNAGEFGIGSEWDAFFSGPSEQSVFDALTMVRDANGDQTAVDMGLSTISQFFDSNYDKFSTAGQGSMFLDFSTGNLVGTGSWNQQPVPEPATLIVLGAAGALAAARARKNRRS